MESGPTGHKAGQGSPGSFTSLPGVTHRLGDQVTSQPSLGASPGPDMDVMTPADSGPATIAWSYPQLDGATSVAGWGRLSSVVGSAGRGWGRGLYLLLLMLGRPCSSVPADTCPQAYECNNSKEIGSL